MTMWKSNAPLSQLLIWIGNEGGDVWIYRFIRDTTGGSDHDLQNIEDDDEYDRAADKFDEWLDTQEFEGFDIEE